MNWHDYFTYNAATGRLHWAPYNPVAHNNLPRPTKRVTGKAVGYQRKDGYWRCRVDTKPVLQHRIIWEMHHGPIPKGMCIDHIDGNPGNNLLSNIRVASHTENMQNSKMTSRNKHGVKGVKKEGERFSSEISVGNKRIYLGAHLTKGLAAVAYAKACLRYHGKFTRITA